MCAHVKWNSPDGIECAVRVCVNGREYIQCYLMQNKGRKQNRKLQKAQIEYLVVADQGAGGKLC